MCVKDLGWISSAVGQFYSTGSPSYSFNPSSLSRQALVTGRALKAMTLFSRGINAVRILVFKEPFLDPMPPANTQIHGVQIHGALKRKHLCHHLIPHYLWQPLI